MFYQRGVGEEVLGAAVKEHRCSLVLFQIDVDGLREYNRAVGLDAGDILLERLRAMVAALDGLDAMHGGKDVYGWTTALEPAELASRLDALRAEFTAATGVGLSAGVARYAGEVWACVLDGATDALSAAKDAGGGCVKSAPARRSVSGGVA
jgi:GGDEF domain-containing protein